MHRTSTAGAQTHTFLPFFFPFFLFCMLNVPSLPPTTAPSTSEVSFLDLTQGQQVYANIPTLSFWKCKFFPHILIGFHSVDGDLRGFSAGFQAGRCCLHSFFPSRRAFFLRKHGKLIYFSFCLQILVLSTFHDRQRKSKRVQTRSFFCLSNPRIFLYSNMVSCRMRSAFRWIQIFRESSSRRHD